MKPKTIPGRPPKECCDCATLPEGQRPRVWRPTDHAKLKPRCVSHQRETHKAAKKTQQATYQVKTYGMTPEMNEELLAIQNGACAICLFATGKTKALATDHDHKTGLVRGKLCGPDNHDIIGRIELIAGRNSESPVDVLLRIVHYFQSPPMARLRLRLEQAS